MLKTVRAVLHCRGERTDCVKLTREMPFCTTLTAAMQLCAAGDWSQAPKVTSEWQICWLTEREVADSRAANERLGRCWELLSRLASDCKAWWLLRLGGLSAHVLPCGRSAGWLCQGGSGMEGGVVLLWAVESYPANDTPRPKPSPTPHSSSHGRLGAPRRLNSIQGEVGASRARKPGPRSTGSSRSNQPGRASQGDR